MEEEDDDVRFKCAHTGDHLMVPFQCEVCHFQNILEWDPNLTQATNRETLDMVRRANLDAFWSRELSMVASNLRELVQMERMTS